MADPRLRREAEPRRLPYLHHVSDAVVALEGGALVTVFRLTGAGFETKGPDELNDLHAKLNLAWRNLADERLALWHHLIRRPVPPAPGSGFASPFARDLDAGYRARLAADPLYATELYLTIVVHPGRGPAGRARGLLRGRSPEPDPAGAGKRLEAAARDLAAQLAPYGPRRLGLYERGEVWFSEPMEMLALLLTGSPQAIPLVRGPLGSALYASRLIFGREALEVREAGAARLAGMLGIKEYPATTRPGLWDALLAAPFPFALSQSFAFLAKPAARAVLERKQNQMLSARDRALSQVEALHGAIDDLASNAFVLGDHHASLTVYGDTSVELGERLARARALLADAGLVAAREDLGLEAAFWAQFPGNFALRTRPAAITSRNFAAFAPFHAHPAGRAAGNHWGPALAVLRTSGGAPYHLNLHVGDLGHTFICGPSGSGKTVLQGFLLAQLERFGAQRVVIDKDRGAELFVRACGGTYLALRNGRPSGFAPLKALAFTPADRDFLARLVRAMAGPGRPLSPAEGRALHQAIEALAPLPPPARSFGALRALLGQQDPDGLGARLDRWRAGGPFGWALDNGEDQLSLAAPLMGFDMTELLDHPEVRTPVMMYLLHRLSALADGRRLVIDVDEFWKALSDEAFRGLAQDGLKTFRKQNALMIFGTQSPADVLASPLAHTVVEQCATKIYLPNPHAGAADYREGFGLTARELQLVRDALAPHSRRFLVKQGPDSVVAELDLTGLGPDLEILSGRAETVRRLDRLRARTGDAPEAWLPALRAALGPAADPAAASDEPGAISGGLPWSPGDA